MYIWLTKLSCLYKQSKKETIKHLPNYWSVGGNNTNMIITYWYWMGWCKWFVDTNNPIVCDHYFVIDNHTLIHLLIHSKSFLSLLCRDLLNWNIIVKIEYYKIFGFPFYYSIPRYCLFSYFDVNLLHTCYCYSVIFGFYILTQHLWTI